MDDDEPITIQDVAELIGELRTVARQLLRSERGGCSIRPTALVMSALRREVRANASWDDLSWQNRHAFFASVHRGMRHALVDHARARSAKRRPRLEFRLPEELDFLAASVSADERPEEILALDEALAWLEGSHPDLGSIVQHHYFTGISILEMAELLETSGRTVKRRLREARVLLQQKMSELLTEA
ncbi:sigma-70 family RNA polymerase sigma factor [soil metagenome]